MLGTHRWRRLRCLPGEPVRHPSESRRIAHSYSQEFFDGIAQGSLAAARVVLPLVFAQIRPSSILDIGCGTGAWLEASRSLGASITKGIDRYSPEHVPSAGIQAQDLASPLDLARRFDLVISLEVAEHLPETAAATFVDSLCRHSDAVLFSAAIPGQGGVDHVNEQWQTYWAAQFDERGYFPHDIVRPAVWNDQRVPIWYRQNILLYLRGIRGAPSMLDVVHPLVYDFYRHPPSIRGSYRNLQDALMRRARSSKTQASTTSL